MGDNSNKSTFIKKQQAELSSILVQDIVEWDKAYDYHYNKELTPNMIDQSTRLTTLHRSAYEGQAKIMQWCIDMRANLEARTSVGRTPLHYACDANKIACIRLL